MKYFFGIFLFSVMLGLNANARCGIDTDQWGTCAEYGNCADMRKCGEAPAGKVEEGSEPSEAESVEPAGKSND